MRIEMLDFHRTKEKMKSLVETDKNCLLEGWKLNIESVPTSEINFDPGKLQEETIDREIKIITGEIMEGFILPILLDSKNNIIDGNHRYVAYKRLGFDNIICFKPSKKYGLPIKNFLERED